MIDENPVTPSEHLSHAQAQFRQGIAAILLGLIAIIVASGLYYWKVSRVLPSAKWPQTPGVVEACNVLRTLNTRSCQIQIKYVYKVDGREFHSDRFNTHNNFANDEGDASNIAQKYRAGNNCTVTYNPADPAQSYLDTTITWHTWASVVISIIIGIAGFGFLALGLAKLFFPDKFSPPKSEPEEISCMDDRVVIGPLFTQGGFQAWYLVCFADTIVAVPQGLWFAITSITPGIGVYFGLIGGAIAGAIQGSRQTHKLKGNVQLKTEAKSALVAANGNVVYSTSDIFSIEVKRRLMSHPELIVTCQGQRRIVYGITIPKACENVEQAIAAQYPNLYLNAESASKR